MAIKLKRSSTPGNIPSVASLALGELALNTYDGTIYLKRNQNGTEDIVTFAESGFPVDNTGYLYNDGAGNLEWTPLSTNTLTNGSYNFTLGVDGTVNFTPAVNGKGVLQTTADLQFNANGSIYNFGANGIITLPAGGDIINSAGYVYKGVDVQDNTVAISTSSQTLNFGTGLIVSVDTGTNITSINVDSALSNISTLNVAGGASVGGNFTVTGGIFAIGTVYSNSIPVLTGQIQTDWNQNDTTQPSYINNKPTLITTILYTKQLNYVGTIPSQVGTIRWYPDSKIAITNAFLNSSTPPSSTNFVVNILVNGSVIGSVTQNIGSYKSDPVTLNYSLLTTDYVTVDVVSGGLAAFGSLTISYTRIP